MKSKSKVKVIGIACCGIDRSIGYENNLIWRSKQDMKNVKKFTTGHSILMGRKTFESLPNGPLPDRVNIVLTRNLNYSENIEGKLYFVSSLEEAISLADQLNQQKLFIFGGEEIYRLAANKRIVDEFLLTVAHSLYPIADAFLPSWYTQSLFWERRELLSGWVSEDGTTFSLVRLVYNPN